jgi:hypothetical protein
MSEQAGPRHLVFAVMVTSGTIIEYAPELYRSRALAIDEAERWASVMGEQLQRSVRRPFEGRWDVGEHDIRVVECDTAGVDPTRAWWLGTHWSSDGSPDPEAQLISGKAAAREWVEKEPGQPLSELRETRWTISATFGRDDNESYSVAHLAKSCERFEPVIASDLVEYDVELTGTFVQSIESRVTGPPGLSRSEIEELVDCAWAEISVDTRVLLESSWELENFVEVPPSGI